MWLYILFCALYRMSSGALLLVVGWSLATADSNNVDSLALATFLSFVPALLVPMMFKWMPRRAAGKATSVACFACLSLLTLMVAHYLGTSSTLVVLVFFLWLFFFALEPLIEAWFTMLAKGLDDRRINRLSSLSMTINQCCLMVGPIVAYLAVNRIGTSHFVEVLALLFGAMALINLAIMPVLTNDGQESTRPEQIRANRNAIIPLALIWPVVGCFNFMVPVYFAMEAGGNMAKAGIVDGCMGIGMALAGLMSMSSVLALPKWRNLQSIFWIVTGGGVWWISGGDITGCAAAAVMLGCGFGAMRIGCRSHLARHFSAQEVAGLISTANAFSLLVLLASLLICKINFAWSWIMPFVLSLCLVVVASLFLNERRGMQVSEKI